MYFTCNIFGTFRKVKKLEVETGKLDLKISFQTVCLKVNKV